MNPSESQFDNMGSALGYSSFATPEGAKITTKDGQRPVVPGKGHVTTGNLTGDYSPYLLNSPTAFEGTTGISSPILGTLSPRSNENN